MALTQISTAGVKDDAVTAGKIPANAVGSSELADNAVDTAAIATDAVTTAKINGDAVTEAKIANNACTQNKIAGNAVTTNKIADDAVTNAKVADDAIGVAQLSASGTASSSTFLRGDNSWTAVNTDLVADTSPQLGGDLDTNGNHILLDDSRQLRLGDDNDMQINHTGSHAYIDNGTGHMYLRGSSNSQILLKPNGSDNSIRCMPGGAAELYHNGSKKFETTSTGVSITGNVNPTGHVALPDASQLRLGSSDDLKIYHDGTRNYIDSQSIQLRIETDALRLRSDSGETYLEADANGAVQLYYDNSKKFETLSDGVNITGTLKVNGSAFSSGGRLLSSQQFTSSGTWTKPSGCNMIRVYVTGGGGGAGGAGFGGDFGGAGGAGGTAIEILDVSSLSTVTVTIGSGGSGGSGSGNGSSGGTSSFGSYCSATGGSGGIQGNFGANKGGVGGTGSGGNINITGGDGGSGQDNSGISTQYASAWGVGGSSYWGGGGGPSSHTGGPGDGQAYGSGGGAANSDNFSDGGDGKAGIVYVEQYS